MSTDSSTSGRFLDGKVALITGAGGGIASATAKQLSAAGATIAAVDLDQAAAQSTLDAIGSPGTAYGADVSDSAAVASVVGQIVADHGGIDILVNAVGIGGVSPIVDHPDDLWDRIIAVNLTSAFVVTRAVLPQLIERGGGRIVNITSRSAYRSSAGTAAYAASKGGLLAFSRVLAVEAGPHGITVNNVAPGTTLTPLVSNYYTTEEAQAAEAVNSGVLIEPTRLTMPEEIAGAVLYLVGPNTDHTSGTTIHVNGGGFIP